MSKPIFTIIGGTGAQGESALHGVASGCPGQFKYRIFTKDPNSAKANSLKEKYGNDIEFVQGSQSNPADFDKAFNGATWAFINTNFWDPAIMLKEAEIGKAFADSAKKNGVKHVIYSTLPDTKKISGGKYHVPHFDLKAEVEQYIRGMGLNAAFIAPAFYYQNWTTFFPPRPNGDGTYSITLPSATNSFITAFDVSEIGKVVSHMVKNWDQFKNKVVNIAGDHLHPQDYVKTIAETTGLTIKLNKVPYDAFKSAAGEELADMMHYFEDCTFYGSGDWQQAKKLVSLTNFKDWAAKNADLLKPKAQA